MNPVINALLFLIGAVFGFYILLIMLRVLIVWLRITVREPLSLFVWQLTSPPVVFLQQFIPVWRNIDFAALVLAFGLEIVKLLLMAGLLGQKIGILKLLLLPIINLICTVLYIFLFSILIEAILSWVTPPNSYSPVGLFLHRLNEPLLHPARQLIPLIQGIDLSPWITCLGLYVLIILLTW